MVAYLSTQMIRAMHTMVTVTTAVKAAPTATAISPPRGRPSDFSKVGASVVWFTPDPVADVATVVARGPTRRLVTDVAKVGASVVWFTPDPVADVATVVARSPTRRLVTEVLSQVLHWAYAGCFPVGVVIKVGVASKISRVRPPSAYSYVEPPPPPGPLQILYTPAAAPARAHTPARI